ncbi:hypothetical protein [Flavobacterium sp. LC2016-12]|uniref:hypothetical protein n=1 Tax=Flavobacterium sp. LC2016-12 TaxID=2783794 RepID=UPI00188C973D|nr:hypothetical protein [Flavobacterium sp. LC2016-12]MBF4464352.1 hypothetical protein [Flavobacterium sp. LC2016-12]
MITAGGLHSSFKVFSSGQPNKLGVIEEGAYADLILVDGNPILNLSIMEDYDKTLLLIIKDGIIYKNILDK